MSEELIPCPFCKAKPISEDNRKFFLKHNPECFLAHPLHNADFHIVSTSYITEHIKAWNTRPLTDEKDKQIKKLLQALNEIQNLTCFPQNKSAVCDKVWNISRSAIRECYFGDDADILTNGTDSNVVSMEE